MIKKLLREPLVHFLILGALLLFVSNLVNKRTSGDTKKIVITPGQVEHLEDSFRSCAPAAPDPDELKGLLRDYIHEEVYYREALALGLDRDDAPIRQRLRQKMEFISEDVAAQAQPTEDQLRSYLAAHPEKFRIDQHFTFKQVYLDPSRHGQHLNAEAQEMLAKLNKMGAAADVSTMGDPFLLEGNSGDVSSRDVARDFGEKFAAALGALPVGTGKDRLNPAWERILFMLKRTPKVDCRSSTKFAMPFVANGPMSFASKRTKNSTKGC